METSLQKLEPEIISSLVINGDLSKLSQDQKLAYYKLFCERLGLDPLTQPFRLLNLQGRQILYCDHNGAQQLTKKHSVSHEIKSRDKNNDLYLVTCRASLPDGRFTDSLGAVTISGLEGDKLANALMKCETKAKRRATLDLLGLGILSDVETETIEQATISDVPFTMEELRDKYFSLLVDYDSLFGAEKADKLNPDKWKEAPTVQRYLDGIKWLNDEILKEREIQEQLRTPHTVAEQGRAIRRAVDKDDFHDERKNKK